MIADAPVRLPHRRAWRATTIVVLAYTLRHIGGPIAVVVSLVANAPLAHLVADRTGRARFGIAVELIALLVLAVLWWTITFLGLLSRSGGREVWWLEPAGIRGAGGVVKIRETNSVLKVEGLAAWPVGRGCGRVLMAHVAAEVAQRNLPAEFLALPNMARTYSAHGAQVVRTRFHVLSTMRLTPGRARDALAAPTS